MIPASSSVSAVPSFIRVGDVYDGGDGGDIGAICWISETSKQQERELCCNDGLCNVYWNLIRPCWIDMLRTI